MGASRGLGLAARKMRICRSFADVAQLVEHFTRNEGVPGSNPGVGSEKGAGNSAFLRRFANHLPRQFEDPGSGGGVGSR
jgi:hypothetical protein